MSVRRPIAAQPHDLEVSALGLLLALGQPRAVDPGRVGGKLRRPPPGRARPGDGDRDFLGLLGEPIEVRFGIVDSLRLGDLEVRNVPVAIMADNQLRFLVFNNDEFRMDFLLGTNLLNKVGVLLLVVGMALFLGYSITSFGPAGRVALGVATSLSLLAAGLFAEKRDE